MLKKKYLQFLQIVYACSMFQFAFLQKLIKKIFFVFKTYLFE